MAGTNTSTTGTPRHRGFRRSRNQAPLRRRVGDTVLEFYVKCVNDWIFNLSAILAFNFLSSMVPILVVMLTLAGLVLSVTDPGRLSGLDRALVTILPAGIGTTTVKAVETHIQQSAGLIFAIGVATSFFLGTRLFIAMENCFDVIFRLRGRMWLHQNVMAACMVVVYALLGPLLFFGSLVPAAFIRAIDTDRTSPLRAFVIQASGVVVAMVVALALFGVLYTVVPNRHVHWREVWPGTLVAASLLLLYEVLFPLYVANLLHPTHYGSVVGFLIVILVFFYYFAFILLLGAEVNAWVAGQRRALGDIAAMVHEVLAHRSLESIVGPRAGDPALDMQHHKGITILASAESIEQHIRHDHRNDYRPPGFWHPPSPVILPDDERAHQEDAGVPSD